MYRKGKGAGERYGEGGKMTQENDLEKGGTGPGRGILPEFSIENASVEKWRGKCM